MCHDFQVFAQKKFFLWNNYVFLPKKRIMSYDLMIIDRHPRFKNSKDFLTWYDDVTKWEDEVDYNDYSHTTKPLKDCFLEMKELIPPLNGPFAPIVREVENSKYPAADYCIAKDAIYVALSYENIEKAKEIAFNLAKKYELAIFDISGSNELNNPDGTHFNVLRPQSYDDNYAEQCRQVFKHRNTVTFWLTIPLFIFVFVCFELKDSWGLYVGVPACIVLVILGIWTHRWINRTNDDVLKRFKDLTTETKVFSACDAVPLLADVLWNFRLGKFKDPMEFFCALKNYNEDVLGKPFDYPIYNKIECLGAESDFILFDDDTEEAEKYQERMAHFYADNHQYFTGLEILYKLNNVLYPLLQDSDSIYFEGIHCYQLVIDERTKRTTCQVLLGS